MAITSSLNNTSSTSQTTSTSSSSSANTTDPQAIQDRFLKLLVAQLTNQDPMNPMDNAQMTTQMAQINTVTGIQQMNATMTAMAAQMASMQVLEGGSLVGRSVLTPGTTLVKDATTGKGTGTFDLDGAATSVNVQISTPGGQVIDTIKLGAQDAGRHSISWDTSKYTGSGDLTFTVTATNGTDTVKATTLVTDTVTSVGADNGALTLQLKSGKTVPYSKVTAVL